MTTDFDAARASFIEGLALHEAGRHADAEAQYLASLQHLPGRVSTLVNLAAVRLALARPADALDAADAALAADAGAADAWLHRGSALAALDRLDAAAAAFDRAAALSLDDTTTRAAALRARAPLLERLSRPADAAAAWQRLLALVPDDAAAWSAYGSLLRETGQPAAAADAYRRAIAAGADPGLHGYYIAAVAGTAAPAEPPPGYVQTLFDGYADGFDEHLVQRLHYQAHERLVAGAAASGRAPFDSALDLGCGTGLAGALLRRGVQRLVGVDVSARMLDEARRRGIYDELLQADLVAHLQTTAERHDLLIAADVMVYLGDHAPFLAAARRAVTDRGLLCLSVERAADADTAFALRSSLRYAHGERALRRLVAEHGWSVLQLAHAPIREDQRVPIDGLYLWLAPA